MLYLQPNAIFKLYTSRVFLENILPGRVHTAAYFRTVLVDMDIRVTAPIVPHRLPRFGSVVPPCSRESGVSLDIWS